MKKIYFTISLLLCFTFHSFSEVKLASCYGENMVLQRDQDIIIRGTSDPEEQIVVSFLDTKAETTADKEGRWNVRFDACPYGGPHQMIIKGANNSIEFNNILIGDVWLCSGQSNMVWSVGQSANPEFEIANASYPHIRLFLTPGRWSFDPRHETSGSWNECNSKNIQSFSAVAYFFAREIYLQTGIPQGLICSAWGASEIEPWLSPKAIDNLDKELKDHYQYTPENYPSKVKEILTRNPERIWDYNPNLYPGVLYNGMIHPFIGFRLKGILWYQGENNAHVQRSDEYKFLFPVLINDWRERWGYELPFYWVQLPSYIPPSVPEGHISWTVLRESQHAALSLPQTGEAVTIDIGDANDVHPRNKQDVGYRLALIALNKLYGRNVIYSGPIYKSVRFQGNKAFLKFDCMGSCLSNRYPNGELKGFSIAGKDQVFEQAKAQVKNCNRLEIYSDKIKKPRYVRYAWENCPLEANLINTEGLPAAPFRTDHIPEK
ncbi:MAG: sialate O-acetylesterase [Bacteroidales bacterium]|nr:sialate O-acetylesterase [Bacteroidales bacterium]